MSETTEYISAKDTAKLIRRDLRRVWPGTKFTVRMSRGTAYGNLHVCWEDGPTQRQVQGLIGHYKGKTFDGMTDSTEYHGPTMVSREDGPALVRYGVGYLLMSRATSAAFDAHIEQQVRAEWGQGWNERSDYDQRRLLWRHSCQTERRECGYIHREEVE